MKFSKKILPNGLRIITVPMEDNPTVTVLVLVEAGTKYETKNINGISHFLEHMCFKGTKKRPKGIQISRELDGLGAQYNAFTSYEYTGYYAKGQKKNFSRFLDLVSDIYLNSTLPKEEIEKEKGVIIGEIDVNEDNPMSSVEFLFLKLLYGNQPAGWSILGGKKTIKKMKRNNFIDYQKKHYVASGTTVIVTGDVNKREVVREIEKKFINIPTTKKYKKLKVRESQKKPAILIKYKKTDQTHLIFGVRTYGVLHKDIPTLEVLAGILGKGMSSRLFERLRDKMGVGYYIQAGQNTLTDHGLLEISAGVDNKRIKEVTKALLEECQKLVDEKVSEKELKKSKDFLIGNMYLRLELSDSLASFYGDQAVLRKPIKTPSEVEKIIKEITTKDIQQVAKTIFQNKGLNLALIGPFKNKKPFQQILKF